MKIKQLSLVALCFAGKHVFGLVQLTKQSDSIYTTSTADGAVWHCRLGAEQGMTEFQNSSYNPSNYPIPGEIASNASNVIDGMDTAFQTKFQCKKQAGVNDECYAPIYYKDALAMGAPTWKIRVLICNKLDNNNKILPVAHPNK